jgi:hypothetical protein
LFSQQMRLIENQKKIINLLNDMRDKEWNIFMNINI